MLVLGLLLAVGGPEVGVLPTGVEGTALAGKPELVTQRALDGLQGLERFAVRAVQGDASCDSAECVQSQGTALGVAYLLRLRLEAEGRDHSLTVAVYDVRSGSMVAHTEASCEVCAESEVEELVVGTVSRFATRIDGLYEKPSLLSVQGSPVGAWVAIDGTDLGETPIRHEVPAGAHQVVVSAQGYASMTQSIDSKSGQTVPIDYTLELLEENRPSVHGPLGWASLAVGVPAIGAGLALIALHGRPALCGEAEKDANGRCADKYGTLAPGIAAAIGGAALSGLGIGLIVRDRKRRAGGGAISSFTLTPRGVSVAGRF